MDKPEYSEETLWWLVEGTEGVVVYEESTYTREQVYLQYPGTLIGEPEVIAGVGVRLIDPYQGDFETPWLEVLPTLDEAKMFVAETWGMHPDDGSTLGL